MIKHIYLYKLKDKSQAKEIAAMLMTMKAQIPPVFDVEIGTDFVGAASSFDLAETVVCRNMEDFRAFCVHPYHDKIRAYMKDKYTEGYKVDYDDCTAENEV